MVMNWGIRPADLIDRDDIRRQFDEEHEPVRATSERSATAPRGPVDRLVDGRIGHPLG